MLWSVLLNQLMENSSRFIVVPSGAFHFSPHHFSHGQSRLNGRSAASLLKLEGRKEIGERVEKVFVSEIQRFDPTQTVGQS